jgi:hypothetical protein
MLLGVLGVMLFAFGTRVGAQSPPPTPVPPTVEPTPPAPPGPEPPELEDPTDILVVLGWLAAGGAGPAVAFFLATQAWFNKLKNDDLKVAIVMSCIVFIPLVAKVLIDLVPPEVWAVIQPYWSVGVGALLIGWPLSQVIYERYIRARGEAEVGDCVQIQDDEPF